MLFISLLIIAHLHIIVNTFSKMRAECRSIQINVGNSRTIILIRGSFEILEQPFEEASMLLVIVFAAAVGEILEQFLLLGIQ